MDLKQKIELITEEIKSRISKIGENNDVINSLAAQDNEDAIAGISDYLDENKLLVKQNKFALELHKKLVDDYISNLTRVLQNMYDKMEDSFDSFYHLTIENQIPFDRYHPYYNDKRFMNMILAHYENREEFEKCAEIYQKLQQIGNNESYI